MAESIAPFRMEFPKIRYIQKKETKESKNKVIKSHIKMENTKRIWILNAKLWSLNCLIAEERITAAKIHLIINATKVVQLTHFKNALTSKFKSKYRLLRNKGFACISTENQKLLVPSRLIWFDQARTPEGEMAIHNTAAGGDLEAFTALL